MTTEAINHDPAHMFMNTGAQIPGRPSMGAWVTYGLGSESITCLASLSWSDRQRTFAATDRRSKVEQWISASKHQGVQLRGKGDAVLLPGQSQGCRQTASSTGRAEHQRTSIVSMNRFVHDPEIATRIAQYEMAFEMQTRVPELMDIDQETRVRLKCTVVNLAMDRLLRTVCLRDD